jgi:GT2 family glycosyltransferase
MLTVHPDRFSHARKFLDEQDVAYRGVLVNHGPTHIAADAQWDVIWDGDNHTYAEGLNKAFRVVDGERVLLVSDDAYMRPGSLKAMLAHSEPIVGCTLVDKGVVNHMGAGFADDTRPVHYGRGTPEDAVYPNCDLVDWVTWACVLLDREVIETVGPVDEAYSYSHEDVDYILSAREAGFGMPRLCVEALVDHPEHGVGNTPRTLKANIQHYKTKWVASGRLKRVLDASS